VVAIRLRIGTRKSAMALAQTAEIARRLTAADPGLEVEIVKFETTGDSDQIGKLLPHGGKGVNCTPRCIRSRTCPAMRIRRAW
jgi:hydroxymethylbilane synthase